MNDGSVLSCLNTVNALVQKEYLKNTLDFVIQLPDNGDFGESKFLS